MTDFGLPLRHSSAYANFVVTSHDAGFVLDSSVLQSAENLLRSRLAFMQSCCSCPCARRPHSCLISFLHDLLNFSDALDDGADACVGACAGV